MNKEIEKERNEEKTATADARIARVSYKQNELNASIHSSTLLLKTKKAKSGKDMRSKEANRRKKDKEKEKGKNKSMHSDNASNTSNLHSFI